MEFNSGQFQFPQNDTRNEIKFSHRRCFSPVLSLSTATTTIGGIIKQAQPPTATGAVVLGWSVMRHTQLAYSSPHPSPLHLVYVFIAVDEEVGVVETKGRCQFLSSTTLCDVVVWSGLVYYEAMKSVSQAITLFQK